MIRSPHAANNWMQVQQQTQKPTNFIQGGGGGGAGQPGVIDQALQAGAGALMSSVLPGPLAGVGTSLLGGLFNEGGQVDPAQVVHLTWHSYCLKPLLKFSKPSKHLWLDRLVLRS